MLDHYWSKAGDAVMFPNPAMYGAGDRSAFYWLVLGECPDLSQPLPSARGTLHACQGLDWTDPGSTTLPPTSVFHSCIGSNGCKGQGGCGFAHNINPGGHTCTGSVDTVKKSAKPAAIGGGSNGCTPTYYNPPADNWCGGVGGCAVPISESQLFPKDMNLYEWDLTVPGVGVDPQKGAVGRIGIIGSKVGAHVYSVAWQVYCAQLKHRQIEPPEQPTPATLRIALPPST